MKINDYWLNSFDHKKINIQKGFSQNSRLSEA